jgi:hypothetical protein
MKTLRLHNILLKVLSILIISACKEEQVIPEFSKRIDLFVPGDLAVFPNHDTLHFTLEIIDRDLEITWVELSINDSVIQLPVSFQNWESPYLNGSFYWYDQETLPIGRHTIKASVMDNQNNILTDEFEVEIVDFRKKYEGHYLFTAFDCRGDTVFSEFEGWVKVFNPADTLFYNETFGMNNPSDWDGNPPTERRVSIHYTANSVITPVLTRFSNGQDHFGYNYYGLGTGGAFTSNDTVIFFYSGCGKYQFEATTVKGVRLSHPLF